MLKVSSIVSLPYGYSKRSLNTKINKNVGTFNSIRIAHNDTVSFTGIKPNIPEYTRNYADEFINFLNPIYDNLSQYVDDYRQAIGKQDGQMDKDEMKSFLKKSDSSSYKVMGVGTNSICYKIPTSNGQNLAIRFFRPDAMNFGNDSTYEKEAFALKKFEETGVKDSQKLIDIFEKDGRHYIVTNLVTGKSLNPSEGRLLTPGQTKDTLKKLTLMDKSGFLQYDAQIDNIFYDGNTAKFIDFGGFTMSIQDKATYDELAKKGLGFDYGSFYPNFSVLKEGDIKKFNLENLLKTTKPYLGFSDIDTTCISRNSNPYFSALSNVANFEYRSIFYHLYDTAKVKSADTSKEILINYLKTKGTEYHKTMSGYFDSLDTNEIAQACQIDSDTIANRIKNASDYEKMLSNLLSKENVEENVLKTELAKMQIRWVSNNKKEAAQTQFESLVSMIRKFKDQDSGILTKYYDDSLSFFDKLKAGIYQIPEGAKRLELDPEYNLVEKLFTKTVQAAQDTVKSDTAKEQINNIKQSSKSGKIIGIIIGAFAVIGSVFAYFRHRNKKMKNDEELDKSNKEQKNSAEKQQETMPETKTNYTNKTNFKTYNMQEFMNSAKK